MKKFKLLPTALMLVLCVGVLAVGVFAITPTKNTISGTVTINASNPEVIISAYSYGDDGNLNSSPFFGPSSVRSGMEIPFGTLAFDLSNANSEDDLKDLDISFVIRIENPTSNELCAYFTDQTLTGPLTDSSAIIETKPLTTEDRQTDVVKAKLSKYTKLNAATSATEYGSCDMEITFQLLKFSSSSTSINLLSDDNKMYLNIEAFDSKFVSTTKGLMLNYTEQQIVTSSNISKDASNPTVVAGDKGLEQSGAYVGLTNLAYTNSSTVALLSATEGRFSFDLGFISQAFEGINAEMLFTEGLFMLLSGNHSSVADLMQGGQMNPLTQGVTVVGSTITIEESAVSATDGKFSLVYMYTGDLELSFSAPNLSDNQSIGVVGGFETIASYDKIVNDGNSTSIQHNLSGSNDATIEKNVSVTNILINETPEEVQSININVNVTQGNMFLIDTSYYQSIASSSISQIISNIQEATVALDKGFYVSEGVISEDGKGTNFEIPYIYLANGNLKLTAIILSDDESEEITYSLNYLDEIENWLVYSLVKDSTNGDYYSVYSSISKNITETSIPATRNNLPVKEIGSGAFRNCTKLEIVDLSNATNLETIGSFAFSSTQINSITILSGVKTIGDGAFRYCKKISFSVDENNTNFSSDEHRVLYDKNKTTLFYGSSVTTFTAPSTLINICDAAFENRTELTTVNLNNCIGLMTLGNETFSGCSSLTSITIPGEVTSIGDRTFSGCSSLTSITIPGEVTSIGNYAFYNCQRLTNITIPEGVTSIGNYAFNNCTSLTEINYNATAVNDLAQDNYVFSNAGKNGNGITVSIGANVTKIPAYLFSPRISASHYAPKITSVAFAEGNVCESIGEYAFYDCQSLTSIEIPSKVTNIGNSAFNNCTSLTEINYNATAVNDLAESNSAFYNAGIKGDGITVNIGAKVTKIPARLFCDYGKLTSVNFSNGSVCESIGEYAFYKCQSLTSITIPNKVTSIGNYAFYNCQSLTSITIREGVTSIGNYAFNNCTSLTEINYNATAVNDLSSNNYVFSNAGKNGDGIAVNIGANVTKIPAYLFYPYNSSSSYAPYVQKITSVNFEGDSVCESIGRNAFSDCSELTNINLPNSLTSIGVAAFSGCSQLANIELPNGLISIGGSAFKDCIGNTSITIPSGVTDIGNYAFYNWKLLTNIEFNATAANDLGSVGGLFYNAGINGDGITVNIGANVTKIPAYLFCDSGKITSVNFSNGSVCENIGDDAFVDCIYITSIELPNSVTNIGNRAFDGCTGLTSIKMSSSVISIGSSAFYDCQSLTSIEIPSRVTSIGGFAFSGCTSLTEINYNAIAVNDLSLDNCVFSNAGDNGNGITVKIGKDVTKIPALLFNPFGSSTTAPNITTVIFEEGSACESIGSSAFRYCESLTSIEIPSSVTSIGNSAFSGCTNLASIKFNGTLAQWNAINGLAQAGIKTGVTIDCTDEDITN